MRYMNGSTRPRAHVRVLSRGAGRRLAAFCFLVFCWLSPSQAAGQESVPPTLTLEQALDFALRNNPTLEISRNDLSVADWNVRSAYGSWLPSASLSSSVSWQGAGEQRFGTITADELGVQNQPSYYLSSYNAGVSFSIDGRTLMAPGQAKRDRDATRAQLRTAEATLRLNVTKAYLDVLRQKEALVLAEQELERAEFNLRLARSRLALGSGNAVDVQQAEVGVGRSQVSLLQSQTAVRTRRVRLLQQLGVDLGAEPELVTVFNVTAPAWTTDDLYDLALVGNPNLLALRASEESARYGVRMARSSYYPSFGFSASLSGFTRQASSTTSLEAQAIAAGVSRVQQCNTLNELVSRLADPLPPQNCANLATTESALEAIRAQNNSFPFSFTTQPPSASFSVSLPVFQGLGRQRELEAARANLNDNRYRVTATELALLADIESGTAVVRTSYESALIEERNQALADEQLRLARERYQLGFASFVDLVEAETVKATADRDRVFSVFTYHDAIADLEATVGTPLRNP